MGMNLGQRRTEVSAASSQEWLGSAHGTESAFSATLAGDSLTGSGFEGVVPSGVLVSETEAGGLWELGDGGAGRAGILLEGCRTDQGDASVAVIWHGRVLIEFLPEGHGIHAGNVDSLPHIDFVGAVPAAPA